MTARLAPTQSHARLVRGVNHVAVVTDDLDRFIAFYTEVFDLPIVFREDTPAFRHAILRTGDDSWLHPAEVAGSRHGAGLPAFFDRGHLDHLALTVVSSEAFATVQDRLRERGLHDGAVDDLGAFHALWFEDPDGMQVEVVLVLDHALRDIHAPRPLVTSSQP